MRSDSISSPPPPNDFSGHANELATCKPSQWDGYKSTTLTAEEDRSVAIAHIVCSTISAICCIAILYASMRMRTLRRFPANMLLWKTLCDLGTSIILIAINASLLAHGDDAYLSHGASLCANGVLAGLTGFFLLASPGWFFALAYNLNRSLHDPFTKPQSRMTKFHLCVWSTSACIGLSIGVLHEYRPNLHSAPRRQRHLLPAVPSHLLALRSRSNRDCSRPAIARLPWQQQWQ